MKLNRILITAPSSGSGKTLVTCGLLGILKKRQVYTPRWAHTDDNHAWVEAWADGRWPVSYTHLDVYKRQGRCFEYDYGAV